MFTEAHGANTIDLNGSALLLNGGGSLGGTVTSTSNLRQSDLQLNGTGFSIAALTIGGSAQLSVDQDATLDGAVIVGDATNSTAVLVINNFETLSITSDAAGIGFAAGSKAGVSNFGTLAKTGGTGTSVVAAPISNHGTITAASGTLEFAGGGEVAGKISGNVVIDGNSTMTVDAGLTAFANLVVGSTGVGGTHGTVQLAGSFGNSGTLTVTGSGKVDMQGNAYTGSNDTIDGLITSLGTAAWSEGGTSDWDDAEITGAASVEITIGGDAVILTDNMFLGGSPSDTDVFGVDDGALFRILADAGIIGAAGSTVTFNDAGTVEKTGGSGNSGISCFFNEIGTGTIMCSTGDIGFTGGEDFNGTLSGGGTIQCSGNATCTFEPGCSVSVGTFDVGNPSGGAAANATTVLNENLGDSASFNETVGSTINLGSNTLTLSGSDALSGLITGAAGGELDDAAGGSIDLSFAALDGGITVLDDGTIVVAHPVTFDNVTVVIDNAFDLTADTAGITQGSGSQSVTVAAGGMLAKTAGSSTAGIGVAVTNNGTITASSGTLSLNGSITGSGTLLVGSSSGLQFNAGVGSGQTVGFADGNSGELVLNETSGQLKNFQATIGGLSVGSSTTVPTNGLDLTHISPGQVVSATLNTLSDVLTIAVTFFGGPFTFQLAGGYTAGTQVDWIGDGNGGSEFFLSQPVACFRRGTHILTAAGEIAVEELAIGDAVATLSGELRPIKWIGRRAYDPCFIAGNRAVLPIRIAAGTFGQGVPARDLWLSPEHALYLDGNLIPARLLVDGCTITQVERIEALEYFHIELESHDILLVEGVPAESYVDCDNREMFHNVAEFATLYPGDRSASPQFCAPRLAA